MASFRSLMYMVILLIRSASSLWTPLSRENTRDAMKNLEAAVSASLLLGNLVPGASSAYVTGGSPAGVTRDGTTFEIVRYRHGRSSVFFEGDDDVMSEYVYNKAGYVATFEAGSEEYKIIYDDDGDVEDVERRDDRRVRALRLSEGQNIRLEGVLEDMAMLGRRKANSCEDCKEAWDTVCGDGLESLCDLQDDYGSVFGKLGEESVDTMCDTFSRACRDISANEACEDRCDSDDRDDDDDDSSSSSSSSSDDDSSDSDDDGDGDACDPNPCLNGGSCSRDDGGGHICSCKSGYGGMACATDTSDLHDFYIEVEFLGDESDWTHGRRDVFKDAADRWQEVVTNPRCPVGTADSPGRLHISATLEYIDGPENTLAEAGATKVLTVCQLTSTAGVMKFDTADVELMEERGNFDAVVLHEMGHVIGVGTLWGDCSRCKEDKDPEWKCPLAVAAYNDLLGNPGGTEGDIIETGGGIGTACGHFSEDIFGDELSSGGIDAQTHDVNAPLSKMTAASLDDTGYVVDATEVDPYTLPSRRNPAITMIEDSDDDEEPLSVMKSVAIESVVELVDISGVVVGETSGVRIHTYGRTVV